MQNRRWVNQNAQLELTDEELVDLFITTTNHWYTDSQNSLFGWENTVREFLIQCLEDPEHTSMDWPLIYVQGKFKNEWIEPKGIFTSKITKTPIELPSV